MIPTPKADFRNKHIAVSPETTPSFKSKQVTACRADHRHRGCKGCCRWLRFGLLVREEGRGRNTHVYQDLETVREEEHMGMFQNSGIPKPLRWHLKIWVKFWDPPSSRHSHISNNMIFKIEKNITTTLGHQPFTPKPFLLRVLRFHLLEVRGSSRCKVGCRF